VTSQPRQIVRWRRDSGRADTEDALAVEEPLEVRVRGQAVSVTMRTPPPPEASHGQTSREQTVETTPGSGGTPWDEDAELAVGFLLTEGMIAGREDIARIDPCVRAPDGNVINVVLRPDVPFDAERLRRNVFMSSSCGVCGKASIDGVHQRFDPIDAGFIIDARVLEALPERLRTAQATFDRTGGLHAAGLFDLNGDCLVVREDVGRHNAVDKAIGHAVGRGWLPLDQHVLMVSGRSSFEIVQKALAARVACVAAVSAPSSLAAEFADASGQTLVGFLRPGRMNVYSHAQRVRFDPG